MDVQLLSTASSLLVEEDEKFESEAAALVPLCSPLVALPLADKNALMIVDEMVFRIHLGFLAIDLGPRVGHREKHLLLCTDYSMAYLPWEEHIHLLELAASVLVAKQSYFDIRRLVASLSVV